MKHSAGASGKFLTLLCMTACAACLCACHAQPPPQTEPTTQPILMESDPPKEELAGGRIGTALSAVKPDIDTALSEEKPDTVLSVRTVRTETVTQTLGYETVRVACATLAEGTQTVATAGQNGSITRTYTTVYIDGIPVSRQMTGYTRTEPCAEVILYGTASTTPRGIFDAPLAGTLRITSKFGWRYVQGKQNYHYGIDLAASVGTPVYAADAGRVVFAGTLSGASASYGNLIILAHGADYRTYYAHLSQILVQTGDAVYAGQLIAKSGATGNVTGPHLHFEIRYRGALRDPEDYLP